MSHEATNWAFGLTGVHIVLRGLLLKLADHHNPKFGCFPDQETLVEWSGLSRSTVNRHLAELETMGLIRRQRRRDPVTKKQLSTRYILAFEKGFVPQDVVGRVSNPDTAFEGPDGAHDSEEVGEQPVDNTGNEPATRVSETGGAVSHSFDTLTCKEPLTPLPPVTTPPPTISDFVGKWPADALGSIHTAEAAFGRLSIGQRHQALQMIDAYRAGIYRLRREPARLAAYLNHRLYEEFEDAPTITSGFFRITPDRPEWDRWVQHIRLTQGPAAAKRTVGQPFIAVSTRWPGTATDATRSAN